MGKFKAPKDITALDNDELQSVVEAALEAHAELAAIDDDDFTDEQLAEFESVAEFLNTAQAEVGSREEAAAQRKEKLAGLRSVGKNDGPEDEDTEEMSSEPAEEPAPAEEPEPAPAEEDEEVEEDPAPKSKQVASVRRPAASRAARRAPKAEAPARQSLNLVAAADVPGYPTGHKFETLSDAGKAIMSRLRALPTTGKQTVRTGALVFQMPKTEFSQENYRGRDSEMLLDAANEHRLSGGNLIAAGGWGAPSDTILDFCRVESTQGLLDLPEVTLTRPGVNYTRGPVFADVFNSETGFWDMDEATAEAGTELKTSYRPEVPDFIERRLDAVGVMMEAGLLLRAGWPELVDRYAELGLVAHQHKLARKQLEEIRAYTGAAVDVPNGFGNALDLINVLEVVATGERERNVMALDETLEVLLPHWVKQVIRVDLSNRTGVDLIDVNDARINAFFAARNLRIQWLYDYQNLTVGAGNIVTAYPTSVEAIMYPAGTYVRGVSDVITLDTIYDSVNLKRNDYVAFFIEQGITVTNPCHDGRRITVPLEITGRTAAADITRGFLEAPAAP
jgi:hypothetical protein